MLKVWFDVMDEKEIVRKCCGVKEVNKIFVVCLGWFVVGMLLEIV